MVPDQVCLIYRFKNIVVITTRLLFDSSVTVCNEDFTIDMDKQCCLRCEPEWNSACSPGTELALQS